MASPTTAPDLRVVDDLDAVTVNDLAMTELANLPGTFSRSFTAADGREYAIQADGDPLVAGQTVAGGRYARGSVSGAELERIETDIAAILVDTGTTIPGLIPTTAAIADAVLAEAVLDHAATAGSLAEYIRISKSLVLGNYVFDNQSYNAVTQFMTAGRIRLFDTAAAVGTATEGGTSEGEFATFTIAGTEHATVTGQPRLVKVSG